MTRIAMLSVHTCPLAALGGKETGGMNVYVRELSRQLGRIGFHVDVFTRSQNPQVPRIVPMGERVRVIHLVAGPECPVPREGTYHYLPEFVESLEAFRVEQGIGYDLIHGHYWLSGVVGLELRSRWGVPLLQMFHTLGALKNELAKERQLRLNAQDPKVFEARLNERLYLLQQCQKILGEELRLDGKNDRELKLLVIRKDNPELNLADKKEAYLDGMFEAVVAAHSKRNDSLANARIAAHSPAGNRTDDVIKQWHQDARDMWKRPLAAQL